MGKCGEEGGTNAVWKIRVLSSVEKLDLCNMQKRNERNTLGTKTRSAIILMLIASDSDVLRRWSVGRKIPARRSSRFFSLVY